MQSMYLQRIMKKNAAKGFEKTKPKQTQFLQRPEMNATVYATMDYENKTAFRPKKTNPNKPNFKRGDGLSAYYTRDCHSPPDYGEGLCRDESGLPMTQAKDELYLVVTQLYRNRSRSLMIMKPSRFLTEIGQDLTENMELEEGLPK